MNKPQDNVRKRQDARVARTRVALGVALVELMHSHSFDDISVQQVLDRADVGRSTFYSHFRGKHDLLLSDAERFFDFLVTQFLQHAAGTRRLAPVAELFGHVRDVRTFHQAVEQSELRDAVNDMLTGYMTRVIGRRMEEVGLHFAPTGLPTAVSARLYAAALVELMRCWLERGAQQDPWEMDACFHALVGVQN